MSLYPILTGYDITRRGYRVSELQAKQLSARAPAYGFQAAVVLEGIALQPRVYSGCREDRTKSRSTVTLGPEAPIRPASTGSPSRSARSRSTPASSSSDEAKTCTRNTR